MKFIIDELQDIAIMKNNHGELIGIANVHTHDIKLENLTQILPHNNKTRKSKPNKIRIPVYKHYYLNETHTTILYPLQDEVEREIQNVLKNYCDITNTPNAYLLFTTVEYDQTVLKNINDELFTADIDNNTQILGKKVLRPPREFALIYHKNLYKAAAYPALWTHLLHLIFAQDENNKKEFNELLYKIEWNGVLACENTYVAFGNVMTSKTMLAFKLANKLRAYPTQFDPKINDISIFQLDSRNLWQSPGKIYIREEELMNDFIKKLREEMEVYRISDVAHMPYIAEYIVAKLNKYYPPKEE